MTNKIPSQATDALKPAWNNLALRLQSAAKCGYTGFTLMQVTVLVNGYGYPVMWSEPKMTRLEPKSTDAEQVFDALCGNKEDIR